MFKKTTLYFLILFILPAGVLFSCSDGDNPVGPGNGGGSHHGGGTKTGTNKSDTTVTLNNGLLTIAIPAGDLKTGTTISMGSSSVAFVDTTDQLHQFELKPKGTTFKKPVTLTFHYDSTWLKGNSPWNIGIAYRNDDNGKWYPAINGDVDTVKHTISIKTKHFSNWSIYTCYHLYMQVGNQLSEDNSKILLMDQNQVGWLLITMEEPPAWRKDPDKSSSFFLGDPLVAPLGLHSIDPKEKYSESLSIDEAHAAFF